ncbi:plasmid partitioning protein RepB [Pseudovibrio sp. Tun.PSC04-5.I4]|uniref:plasmid partitioning protein RepB n=1 Tax=Pseudovibrio sp. Tun.PSC04-5.I4 TaxID=1798213 RepID=UPI00087E1024|nr:plasmid partitioning protein RepB [Pseudovibrio sp. Tun.PSC04-5.I4]SDQ18330.1 chromosome partitioning protein, ParB family [Pseudovibrio sp. Tun.PSC04-5.I4]
MNKATDRSKKMRAMFGGVDPAELSKTSSPAPSMTTATKQRVSSGAIKSMRNTFSNVEKENEKLRQMMEEGSVAHELDTADLDPSFVADRMIVANDQDFETLKASISSSGQQVPILVRPHLEADGRYQIAFGHRRWRACKDLGIPVRGFIKELSDEALLIAQGQENHERKNLSFIETALFASRLARSFPQTVISKAIGKDATTVSKLLKLMNALPEEFVREIGPAPKIGRPRWEELAGHFTNGHLPDKFKARVDAVTISADFELSASDERFSAILTACKSAESNTVTTGSVATAAKSWLGNRQILIKDGPNALSIQIDARKDPELAAFLKKRLPDLMDEFRSEVLKEDV